MNTKYKFHSCNCFRYNHKEQPKPKRRNKRDHAWHFIWNAWRIKNKTAMNNSTFYCSTKAPFHPMHLFFHTPLTLCQMKTWGCEWYTSSLLRNKGIDVEPWLLPVWWGANWSKKVPGHSWPGYLPPHPWPSWSNPSPPGTGCSVSSWLPWELPKRVLLVTM